MKIRGTPAHIAEKYLSLARDAQSSGDPVLAENYLQHAEHYSRIIMAYREQMHQSGEGYNGNGQQRLRGPNEAGEPGDDFGEDEVDDLLDDGGFPQPSFQAPQHASGQPQPRQHGYDNNRHENRHERPFRRDHGRFRDRDRNLDRERHNDRDRGERQAFENRPQPQSQPERPETAADVPAAAPPAEPQPQQARRRERFQPQPPHEQPEFLRRPVRRSRASEEETPDANNNKEEPSRD